MPGSQNFLFFFDIIPDIYYAEKHQQQLEGMDEKAASCHQGVFWSQISILGNKVNSVQEVCSKYFAVDLLKFEIFETT